MSKTAILLLLLIVKCLAHEDNKQRELLPVFNSGDGMPYYLSMPSALGKQDGQCTEWWFKSGQVETTAGKKFSIEESLIRMCNLKEDGTPLKSDTLSAFMSFTSDDEEGGDGIHYQCMTKQKIYESVNDMNAMFPEPSWKEWKINFHTPSNDPSNMHINYFSNYRVGLHHGRYKFTGKCDTMIGFPSSVPHFIEYSFEVESFQEPKFEGSNGFIIGNNDTSARASGGSYEFCLPHLAIAGGFIKIDNVVSPLKPTHSLLLDRQSIQRPMNSLPRRPIHHDVRELLKRGKQQISYVPHNSHIEAKLSKDSEEKISSNDNEKKLGDSWGQLYTGDWFYINLYASNFTIQGSILWQVCPQPVQWTCTSANGILPISEFGHIYPPLPLWVGNDETGYTNFKRAGSHASYAFTGGYDGLINEGVYNLDFVTTEPWISPKTGHVYPMKWIVTLLDLTGSVGMKVSDAVQIPTVMIMTPIAKNCEIYDYNPADSYWEGATVVTDLFGNVIGEGFVEQMLGSA